VGVDPCDTLDDNPYVHTKVKKRIEHFHADASFDLITLRMVAEHIESPHEVLASLSRATRPGGLVVVYTVNKWSPVSVVARLVPFSLHYVLKRLVWHVEGRDTHPVVYRMNTRRSLARAFRAAGFRERYFARLDDCRASGGSRWLRYLELSTRLLLRRCSLPYPEACLLAVFERR
jgi:SAM-dependent methyltransferase